MKIRGFRYQTQENIKGKLFSVSEDITIEDNKNAP